jgi:hypothetical protein
MVAVYVAAVYWVYRVSSTASNPTARLVPLATGMALVPCVLAAILAIFSIVAKSFRYRSRLRAAAVSPEIRESLASAIVGDGDRERLRWFAQYHRPQFAVIFTEFLASFGGNTNAELSTLAIELGLAEEWRLAARSRNFLVQKTALANLGRIRQPIDPSLLAHPLEQTRIEAACAFLASGAADAPAIVFKMLPEQSPLGRIRLADSLQPFATEICERYMSDAIQSTDLRRARASFDLLRAWELWIPIDGFERMLAGRETDLRLAALPALRYACATEEESAREIFDLLESADERLHAPAAKAAADIGISSAIPLLVNQLRKDGPVSALAAAQALAGMGAHGQDLLEEEIVSSARPQYALYALEQSLVAERG